MYTNNEYCGSFKEQGIRVHFPHSTTPSEVVFNGLDSGFWKESEERLKERNRCIAVFSENQFEAQKERLNFWHCRTISRTQLLYEHDENQST